jgi:beta-mannosidase
MLAMFLTDVASAQPDPTLRMDHKFAWPRQEQLLLDGPWQLAWTDPPKEPAALPANLQKLEWLSTTVPAEVHWALHRAGKAPHPYVGLGAKEMRWVEDKAWWFRRKFTAPSEFKGKQLRLIFDGVDYYGRYWLNGQYLGRSEGAFGAVKIGANHVRFGKENDLVVRVDCAGYKLGRQGGSPHASLVKSELWSGWQLGAEDFNTVGIWQSVRLVANDWPALERPFVHTLELTDRSAKVRVTAEVCTIETKDKEVPCEVRATIRGKGFESAPVTGSVQVRPLGELVLADVDLVIPEPKLWWPNGLGQQPMYEAQIELVRDGKRLDSLSVPFGIRTIERRLGPMQRTSYEMKEWIFHVNGKPMFVKGTNWMPIDALADVDPENYEWHLTMARDAGIQMIRIWGGGILETQAFYDLCDRLGIMVWQDFPMSCGWQAAKLNRGVWKNTVMWNVFRLRNHPSLAFWCGGNEFPPDDRANTDLVGIMARATRTLDGTRPFMGASPDEGDHHSYHQWDASWAWRSELVRGPFVSEWGSHGMPTAQTYREVLSPKESEAVVGPTLMQMNEKLMKERFPEITHHWVEFNPGRLPQMLARGSAFDNLAAINLERFTEAVAAGSAEFYKYSAEAARFGYPQNGGLLFWVWKRPWPITGIQIVDGLGQPLSVYYDVKRAFSSPWPCLMPPHLDYAPGDQVETPTAVLAEANGAGLKGLRLAARLIGPDLKERQAWRDLPALDVPAGSESARGPALNFTVPPDFARAFFFVVLDLTGPDGKQLARNVYTFRCPPQLEDKEFREKYRATPQPALLLSQGPWLRPQLEKQPTELSARVLSLTKESDSRSRLVVEVKNTGRQPAVMTNVRVAGPVRHVADDAFFWLEPGEQRRVALRLRLPPELAQSPLSVVAEAWNAAGSPVPAPAPR